MINIPIFFCRGLTELTIDGGVNVYRHHNIQNITNMLYVIQFYVSHTLFFLSFSSSQGVSWHKKQCSRNLYGHSIHFNCFYRRQLFACTAICLRVQIRTIRTKQAIHIKHPIIKQYILSTP